MMEETLRRDSSIIHQSRSVVVLGMRLYAEQGRRVVRLVYGGIHLNVSICLTTEYLVKRIEYPYFFSR